ncbi:MAG: HD domain-containing protein [Anaerolineales bacterium]|nr:HD domain-containing protein [Anaerolineales bacterium]
MEKIKTGIRHIADWPLFLISVVTLLICLFYGIAGTYIAPYSGIEYDAGWRIIGIANCLNNNSNRPEWCAADADILAAGDQMISIGDLQYEDFLKNQDRIPFWGNQPGDTVSISIVRNGSPQTILWTLVSPALSDRFKNFIQMLVYIPFWLAGTAVLILIRPRNRRWFLLVVFNYATAVYLAVGMSISLVNFSSYIIHVATWLIAPLYIHLHLEIPNPLFRPRRRVYLLVLYLAGAVLALLELFHVLPRQIFYLGLAGAIIGSLGLLGYRLLTRLSAPERLALRLMFLGIGMAFLPGLLFVTIPLFTNLISPSTTALVATYMALPLLPFFYFYAIYKRSLGEFELRANRALSLYSFILLYSLAVILVFSIASQSLHLADESLAFSLAVTLIFLIIAPGLRARFQRWFDTMAYGARHNPQEIVREFALQLPAAFKPALLIRLLSREVTPSLLIRESALYQKTEIGFSLFYADGLTLTDRLVEVGEMEALITNAGRYRPPDHVAADQWSWVRLAVALQTGGKTSGVWLFGRRDPDDFYPHDDILLLRTLGSQVAPMLENLRLYAETQSRLERLQTLRDIDITISSSLDLHFTLEILLDQVSRRSNVDAVDVLLLNAKTMLLEFMAGKGFHSDALHHTHLRLGEGYAGQAAHERRLIFIQNLDQDVGSLARSPKFPTEHFKSYCAAPLIVKGQVKGVLEVFFRTALAPDADWFDFLESLTVQAAIAIDNASLFDELQHSNAELNLAYDTTIEGWSRALDLRDEGTEGHTERVTEMTERLARAMGMDENQMVHVRRGALLHDMGKMGIPDSILLKRDALSREEWDVMRRHPLYAYEMLSPIIYLRQSLDIPYCHHEKWDGSGYPRGLKGDQIPLAARVFAIVDVWDATTSDRPYRLAWTKDQAREYLLTQSGKHFDPQIVPVFLSIID